MALTALGFARLASHLSLSAFGVVDETVVVVVVVVLLTEVVVLLTEVVVLEADWLGLNCSRQAVVVNPPLSSRQAPFARRAFHVARDGSFYSSLGQHVLLLQQFSTFFLLSAAVAEAAAAAAAFAARFRCCCCF